KPLRSLSCFPVFASQTRTVVSAAGSRFSPSSRAPQLADSAYRPSRVKATRTTEPVWPSKTGSFSGAGGGGRTGSGGGLSSFGGFFGSCSGGWESLRGGGGSGGRTGGGSSFLPSLEGGRSAGGGSFSACVCGPPRRPSRIVSRFRRRRAATPPRKRTTPTAMKRGARLVGGSRLGTTGVCSEGGAAGAEEGTVRTR